MIVKAREKDAVYFAEMQDHYWELISDNVLLTVSSTLEAVASKRVSLLTTDVKTRKLVRVSRETTEKALKSLSIADKVLAKRSNAMCDIIQDGRHRVPIKKIGKDANKIHEHLENKYYASRGTHGHYK